MAETLLIDGHNLIGALPGLKLSDPDDEARLAHTLRCLLTNPVRRASIAAACAERARSFDADSMGASYARLYAGLTAIAGAVPA